MQKGVNPVAPESSLSINLTTIKEDTEPIIELPTVYALYQVTIIEEEIKPELIEIYNKFGYDVVASVLAGANENRVGNHSLVKYMKKYCPVLEDAIGKRHVQPGQ